MCLDHKLRKAFQPVSPITNISTKVFEKEINMKIHVLMAGNIVLKIECATLGHSLGCTIILCHISTALVFSSD